MDTKNLRCVLSLKNDQYIVTLDRRSYNNELLKNLADEFEYGVFYLDGKEIKSKQDLLSRLSDTLKFPNYFGYNWDALDECIRDLEWLEKSKGYILIFLNPDLFMSNAPADFHVFLEIILEAAKEWRTEQVKFLLALVSDKEIKID